MDCRARRRSLHSLPGFALVLLGLTVFLVAIAPASVSQTALQEALPPAQIHSLPPALAQWQPEESADYFTAIQPSPLGYLIWSRFPIRVYVEPIDAAAVGFDGDRARAWAAAVRQALKEWSVYLQLAEVDRADAADIQIWRRTPPLKRSPQPANPHQGDRPDQLPRVQTAETRYQLFVDRTTTPATLAHRFTVYLSPSQSPVYMEATARHELGHALGIWGHSPLPTDALYFSQVRSSPPISQRDINTLKRIYQQPTQLGWEIMPASTFRCLQNQKCDLIEQG